MKYFYLFISFIVSAFPLVLNAQQQLSEQDERKAMQVYSKLDKVLEDDWRALILLTSHPEDLLMNAHKNIPSMSYFLDQNTKSIRIQVIRALDAGSAALAAKKIIPLLSFSDRYIPMLGELSLAVLLDKKHEKNSEVQAFLLKELENELPHERLLASAALVTLQVRGVLPELWKDVLSISKQDDNNLNSQAFSLMTVTTMALLTPSKKDKKEMISALLSRVEELSQEERKEDGKVFSALLLGLQAFAEGSNVEDLKAISDENSYKKVQRLIEKKEMLDSILYPIAPGMTSNLPVNAIRLSLIGLTGKENKAAALKATEFNNYPDTDLAQKVIIAIVTPEMEVQFQDMTTGSSSKEDTSRAEKILKILTEYYRKD